MALPVLLLPYYLLTRPSKKNTYDPSTGIGRGAPGFQTGSTRVALPASIVARIRMGEEVGSEEITEALEEEERKRKEEEEERRRQREADERVSLPLSLSFCASARTGADEAAGGEEAAAWCGSRVVAGWCGVDGVGEAEPAEEEVEGAVQQRLSL